MVRLSKLLPVAAVALEGRPSSLLSRSVRQRIGRRSHLDRSVNDSLDAVNWLGGCAAAAPHSVPNDIQDSFLSNLSDLVFRRNQEERSFSETEHEAVRALLRGKAGVYESAGDSVGGLATFDSGRISLPEHVHDCPLLAGALSGEALEAIESFESVILNSAAEQSAIDANVKQPCLYHDPVLAAQPRTYSKFIRNLKSRGLIRYTITPRQHVTLFFVRKKNGKLRLIIDAREVNRHCRQAPSVSLSGPEVLSSLECEQGDQFFYEYRGYTRLLSPITSVAGDERFVLSPPGVSQVSGCLGDWW